VIRWVIVLGCAGGLAALIARAREARRGLYMGERWLQAFRKGKR